MAFLCILRPCQKWGDDANRPVIISTIHHVEAAVCSVIQKCTLLLYHISVLQIARVETEIVKSYVVCTLETIHWYKYFSQFLTGSKLPSLGSKNLAWNMGENNTHFK